jgi:hypothetical protein
MFVLSLFFFGLTLNQILNIDNPIKVTGKLFVVYDARYDNLGNATLSVREFDPSLHSINVNSWEDITSNFKYLSPEIKLEIPSTETIYLTNTQNFVPFKTKEVTLGLEVNLADAKLNAGSWIYVIDERILEGTLEAIFNSNNKNRKIINIFFIDNQT